MPETTRPGNAGRVAEDPLSIACLVEELLDGGIAHVWLFQSERRSTRISQFGGRGLGLAMLRAFGAESFLKSGQGPRLAWCSKLQAPTRMGLCMKKGDHRSQSKRCLLALSDIL